MVAVVVLAAIGVAVQLPGGHRTRVSTSPPATPTPTVATCQPDHVSAEVKMTKDVGAVLVTNTSSSTCTLEGYPGLQVLNASATSAKASDPGRSGKHGFRFDGGS